MFKKGFALALFALLTGCATPPQQHAFDKTRNYAQNFDATWSRLIQYFTSNNIQVKTIEKASGVVYAERALVDYTTFADCGQPGLARVVGTSATLNVFAVPDGDQTKVTVNTNFTQVRQFERNVWTVQCTSTGNLEQQLLSGL